MNLTQRRSICGKTLIIPVCLVLVAAAWPVHGQTVTLNPIADTSLSEGFPNNNMGGTSLASGRTASFGRMRALLQFDVSAIPANVTITSVELTVRVTQVPAAAVSANFDLHRVLQEWGEGDKGTGATSGTGAPATEGEATWENRMAPSTPWSSPGAAAPDDFLSAVSATRFIGGPGGYTFASTPQLVSDVQAWVADPEANFGWMLICQDEHVTFTAKRFGSREMGEASAASLTVEYTASDPDPPHINEAFIENGLFNLQFTAQAGQGYTVEFREAVDAGDWATLTTVDPPDTTAEVVVTDSLDAAARYYRVKAP